MKNIENLYSIFDVKLGIYMKNYNVSSENFSCNSNNNILIIETSNITPLRKLLLYIHNRIIKMLILILSHKPRMLLTYSHLSTVRHYWLIIIVDNNNILLYNILINNNVIYMRCF